MASGAPKKELQEFERSIQKANPGLLDNLPAPKRNQIIQLLAQAQGNTSWLEYRSHSGPVPPGEELIKYNEAAPGGGDRILVMAEKQQSHRLVVEDIVIRSQRAQAERGQIIGAVLVALLIVAGAWITVAGHDTVGGIVFGTTIVGVATLFILGKAVQKKDLHRKSAGD